MMKRFTRSQELLARAERVIPGGSQTFSKSRKVYPYGAAPFFLTHGQGSRVWDVDGNEYIDFNNGLAAITLGYNDEDVTRAVEQQLRHGVTFSLSHPAEIELAETLAGCVPCAEMVRFAKNGSDVTAGAIRLARAYTGREHVAVCGYHGWQDWYIGISSMNRGVPKSTKALTHAFAYNDLQSLNRTFEEHPQQIAAVILEPIGMAEPNPGYLREVKDITARNGALLIFDEIVSGFRCAKGGAQELFSVVPDLATFGKGIANGYPVSVLAGSAKVMRLLESDVFFSLTYAGETLSLAAALATLRKIETNQVIDKLSRLGRRLKTGVQQRIEANGAGDILETSGHVAGSWVLFKNVGGYMQWHVQTLFLQEILARGILTFGKHNISYAHSHADIDRLLAVYDEVLPILRRAVDTHSVEAQLRCEPLQPFFKIR